MKVSLRVLEALFTDSLQHKPKISLLTTKSLVVAQ